jgi:hypothetical protein
MNYFVSSSTGDDFNNGLSKQSAWKTLLRVDIAKLKPGDIVYFKCGDVWRADNYQMHLFDSGTTSTPIIFDAYGDGEKPCFMQSYNDLIWSLDSGNIWYAPIDVIDVAGIVFDNDNTWGIKKNTSKDLKAQNDFYYDPVFKMLKLWSIQDPTFYKNMEVYYRSGVSHCFFAIENTQNVIFRNLAFKYNGAHSIGGADCKNIKITACDFSWIGGAFQYGLTRFGNAIQFWNSASGISIYDNRFNQIYDSAMTLQGQGADVGFANCAFENNVIMNAEMGFEFWDQGAGSFYNGIMVRNNVCLGAGKGFSHGQRPDPLGVGMMCYSSAATISNFNIVRNIFVDFIDDGIPISIRPSFQNFQKLFLDYNIYSKDDGILIRYGGIDFTIKQFKEYQQKTGQDMHSILI